MLNSQVLAVVASRLRSPYVPRYPRTDHSTGYISLASKVEGQAVGHVLGHRADWTWIHIGTSKQCPLLDI
jgi:hypothetical protein